VISGADFQSGATVTFGATAATSVIFDSATQLRATAPAGSAGTVGITVTNPDGQANTLANAFTYSPGPAITSVTPATGPVAGGTAASIFGTNFQPGASVFFGGVAATVTGVTATEIAVQTPPRAAGTVDVQVRNPDNQSSTLPGAFTYLNPPTIASVTPNTGPTAGGTTVTITGANFLATAMVVFGSTPAASVVVNSSTQITAVTPAHTAATVGVTVVNPDPDGIEGNSQETTLPNAFSFANVDPTPVVSVVSPDAGPDVGGTAVIVSGENFQNGARVFFAGIEATGVIVLSPTQISATTPAGSEGQVTVTVQNPAPDLLSGERSNAFTYLTTNELGAVTPIPPELPRAQVDTTMPDTSSFAVVTVNDAGDPLINGTNLQNALNSASCGTVIRVAAGATFRRSAGFTVPAKNCAADQWLIIRTTAPDSALPTSGTRISHAFDAQMPLLTWSQTNAPGVLISPGSVRVRLIGIRVRPVSGAWTDSSGEGLRIGVSGAAQNEVNLIPDQIIIDHVIIEGISDPPMRMHGIAMHCGRGVENGGLGCAVVDSMVERAHGVGFDTQGIRSWNGLGPFLVRNNYIEGSSMCILTGGAAPTVTGWLPNDWTIQQNYCFKPLSWMVGDPSYAGTRWQVKNHFEVKLGKRFLVEGNVFENVWTDAQTGEVFLLRQNACDGACLWAEATDITVRYNKTINSNGVYNLAAQAGVAPLGPIPMVRVAITDNLSFSVKGGSGRYMLLVGGGLRDVRIQNNTIIKDTSASAAVAFATSTGTLLRIGIHDNIFHRGSSGISGSACLDATGSRVPCTNLYDSWFRNLVYETSPAGTWCTTRELTAWSPNSAACPVADEAAVRFVDAVLRNYRLANDSPGRNRSTTGDDVGLTRVGYNRMECLTNAAVAGVSASCP
jgi:hypothetical protein